MNIDEDSYLHRELTDAIICCFYTVYNILGFGFLEKVYENALLTECRNRDITATGQSPISVYYGDISVGEYFADILVENKVIVEVKAVKHLVPEHEAQLLNYLKATSIEVGLLLNFGPHPEIKRRSFDNKRKGLRPVILAADQSRISGLIET
jgi:GxxExxY protein